VLTFTVVVFFFSVDEVLGPIITVEAVAFKVRGSSLPLLQKRGILASLSWPLLRTGYEASVAPSREGPKIAQDVAIYSFRGLIFFSFFFQAA